MTRPGSGWLRRCAVALTVVAGSLGGGACGGGLSDLANFLDSPFADLSAGVTELDGPQLGAVMDELMLRFRTYLTLRDVVDFNALAPAACMSQVSSGSSSLSFVADVPCTFGASFDPTSGSIFLRQEQVATDPVVLLLDVEYRDVVVGDLIISGSEHIDETSGDNGASIREVDVVQNGVALDYTFRAGLLDGDVPVFDYQLPAAGGDVLARVSNPVSPGGFVSVVLTGLDGALVCEVRDAAWAPGEAARGTCCDALDVLDDGTCATDSLVFGLPEGP
ncbi:MAG: hypothetical protein CVU56_02175 [Deltaproteobacteria bacterium HGW-Deltaproteobacteria-14]|nr:MAG: hypothetical protein CVU56_02175 [Deltaproteobacteria bacterium HGW-Deltaproteobacteria-14]